MKRSLLIIAAILLAAAPAHALEETWTTDKNAGAHIVRNLGAPAGGSYALRVQDVAVGNCVLKSSAANATPLACATGGTDFENVLSFTAPLSRAIDTVSIAANGIDETLFRQSAANTLVGNPTGSTANVTDITLGAGCSFSGGALTCPGTGANVAVHYVTTQAEAGLSNEFNLGGLSSGILGHTVAAGVSTPINIVPSTGLTLSSPNLTANLSTGVAGGQSVIGGTAASNALTLSSTSNATKGKILFGTSGYDENTNRLGLGTASPANNLNVVASGAAAIATIDSYHTAGLNIPILWTRAATGSSASPGNVANGDIFGEIVGGAYAGGSFRNVAAMNFQVGSGTISGTSVPARIYFETTAAGSVGRLERMSVEPDGAIRIVGLNAGGHVSAAATTGQLSVSTTIPVADVTGAVPSTRTITAGAGMTGGGDFSANRTVDVVAGDATIVVHADDIVAGVMQTANIADDAITNAKAANMATQTFKGRTTSGTGDPEDLTATQATAMLNVFSSTLKGLAPASGGGTTTFLRADGTYAVPPGTGGGGTVTTVTGAAPIVITSTPTTTPNVTVSYDAATVTLNGSSQLQVAAQTGDVTKPAGSNVTTIAANAVTFGKWQTLTSDRLAGRDSAGTGNAEEIALGTGLQFTGAQSIRITDTAVTPGTYPYATITVDQQGRLTAATGNTILADPGSNGAVYRTSSGVTAALNGTAGSVPYFSSTGVLGQDNANFFWDGTTHRLGIGTTAPGQQLHIVKDAAGAFIQVDSYSGGALNRPILFMRSARGSVAVPANDINSDLIGEFVGAGYAGGAFRNAAAVNLQIAATGTISATSLPSRIYFETTPDGSVSRTERASIESDGQFKVQAYSTVAGVTTGNVATSYTRAGDQQIEKQGSGNFYVGTLGSQLLGFYTSNITRMSIASGGAVTINSLGTGLVKATSGALGLGVAGTDYQVPLTFSTGLSGTTTITANLSTGVSGGQTIIGGTAGGNSLTYSSTSNATKGSHIWGTTSKMVFDEANTRLYLGGANQNAALSVNAGSSIAAIHFANGTADSGGYLISTSADQGILTGGANFNGANWVAKATTAALAFMGSGSAIFYADSGLTAGNTFTPTARLTAGTSGVTVHSLGTGLVSSSSGVLGNATVSSPLTFSGGALGLPTPSGGRVVAGNTGGNGFVSSDAFRIDTSLDQFLVMDGAMIWRSLGSFGSANYEQVRAYSNSSQLHFLAEAGGTGNVNNVSVRVEAPHVDVCNGSCNSYFSVQGTGQDLVHGNKAVPSATSAVLDAVHISGVGTVSGTTPITTAGGFNGVTVAQASISSAASITYAATFRVEEAPQISGGGAITKAYGSWVSGLARFDGGGGAIFEMPADATGNASAAVGRIPVIVGGTLKYIRYYND